MRLSIRMLLAAVLLGACGARAAAQPGAVEEPLPQWVVDRLTALDPREPAEYFRLGEEVMSEGDSHAEEELAKALFGLACELDRRRASPTWIAPSSCIALASLARLESDRRWFRALANQLDPSYSLPEWQRPEGRSGVSETAFDAAEAIGETRAGNGHRARDLLQRSGVRELISRYGTLLGYSSGSGAVWQVDQWASQWPCRECGNERVVFRPNTDPPSYRECYTCRGNPGPTLKQSEIVNHLRFESRLLHGISRSWGAQLAIDHGAPLRDPSLDEIAGVLGIDPARAYWRAGAWVESPEAAPAEAPTIAEPGTAEPGDEETTDDQ